MTLQQLRYALTVAESGTFTDAAEKLFISQPSLSAAIKELEKEMGISIFIRSHSGVSVTAEGLKFLGYARQVIEAADNMTDRYIGQKPENRRFCVSTQHYTFTSNAFAEIVNKYRGERYEFILNETETHRIITDVRERFCDLGILYICNENRQVLEKVFKENDLVFTPVIEADPHVFLHRSHPLAKKTSLKLEDLAPYPKLSFIQGAYESPSFAEEPFSSVLSEKNVRVSDRAAIVNFMIGIEGYTISSGIFPRQLQGDEIIAVPLDEDEHMVIGYLLNRGQTLSELGQIFVEELKAYA